MVAADGGEGLFAAVESLDVHVRVLAVVGLLVDGEETVVAAEDETAGGRADRLDAGRTAKEHRHRTAVLEVRGLVDGLEEQDCADFLVSSHLGAGAFSHSRHPLNPPVGVEPAVVDEVLVLLEDGDGLHSGVAGDGPHAEVLLARGCDLDLTGDGSGGARYAGDVGGSEGDGVLRERELECEDCW